MTSLVAIVFFAGFVLLALHAGAQAGRGRGDEGDSRRGATLFILWALGASFAAGLAQRDAWPFASWPLVATLQPETATHPRIVAIDDRGREHLIDARAWEPLSADELAAWLGGRFPGLPPDEQKAAAAWLLARAEAAREAARRGRRPGYTDRFLGRVRSPLFLLHPRLWDDPGAVPESPFTGLRLYLETWDIEERQSGSTLKERRLLYEFDGSEGADEAGGSRPGGPSTAETPS